MLISRLVVDFQRQSVIQNNHQLCHSIIFVPFLCAGIFLDLLQKHLSVCNEVTLHLYSPVPTVYRSYLESVRYAFSVHLHLVDLVMVISCSPYTDSLSSLTENLFPIQLLGKPPTWCISHSTFNSIPPPLPSVSVCQYVRLCSNQSMSRSICLCYTR
ncbi:hypothetical protein D915_000021 [Fasciola hepatica]|uniref:Uncharacterized protein n=1 Tax=Fasciola hepatica TaxID=6192 RepID=A0A4E0RN67_FASHE|nr:hypothetical protein D915_000021 [Fasciola hepatica]